MRELVTWLKGPEREPQRATEWWAKRRSKFQRSLFVSVRFGSVRVDSVLICRFGKFRFGFGFKETISVRFGSVSEYCPTVQFGSLPEGFQGLGSVRFRL